MLSIENDNESSNGFYQMKTKNYIERIKRCKSCEENNKCPHHSIKRTCLLKKLEWVKSPRKVINKWRD